MNKKLFQSNAQIAKLISLAIASREETVLGAASMAGETNRTSHTLRGELTQLIVSKTLLPSGTHHRRE
jgi:hypothetical protein